MTNVLVASQVSRTTLRQYVSTIWNASCQASAHNQGNMQLEIMCSCLPTTKTKRAPTRVVCRAPHDVSEMTQTMSFASQGTCCKYCNTRTATWTAVKSPVDVPAGTSSWACNALAKHQNDLCRMTVHTHTTHWSCKEHGFFAVTMRSS